MKSIYFYWIISLFIAAIFLECKDAAKMAATTDRYAHIPDTRARAILQASITQAGGIERWESVKRLSYTKNYTLLLESGEVESEYRQTHDYQFDPLIIDIQSEENGVLIHTRLEAGLYSRTRDGIPVETPQEALATAVNTSTYVVSLPFKLLDTAAIIQYAGETTLADGRVVDILQVSYDVEENPRAEVWKYYFDRPERRIVANWVRSGDHHSFIENQSYVQVSGILFNQKRQSFRVDSLGHKLYLRADYLYDNYEVK